MSSPLRDKFLDAMSKEGLAPAKPDAIVETFGKLKRYQTLEDKPKKQSGYYLLSIDGDFASGCFGSHRQGETHKWHTKLSGKKLTEAEKQAYREKVERAKQERDAELDKQRQQAENKAGGLIKDAQPASDSHPYLQRKGVGSVPGLKQAMGNLLVPVWNMGKIVGIQYIDEDGDKKFLTGTRMRGSYFPIADKSDSKSTILICEGVATGITLREATGKVVLCAFNSTNMLPVAEGVRAKYPDAEIILCADNDQWTVKAQQQEGVDKNLDGDHHQWAKLRELDALYNPGLEAAKKAAHNVGGYVCVPKIPSDDKLKRTDFNDLYQMLGIEAVAEQLGQVGDAVVAAKLGLDGKDGTSPATNLPSPIDESGKDKEAVPASNNPQPASNASWLDQLVWTNKENGKLDSKRPLYNGIIWLREHKTYAGKFVYNEFTKKTIIAAPLPWDKEECFQPREIDNRDLTRIKADLEKYGMSLPMSTVKDAIEVASEANTCNPVLEYFERLVWDGKPRLGSWLIDCCGAREQEPKYTQAVGSRWLIAAAKRVYEPGTKFDHMLVLEGKQGVKKSAALKTLATFGNGSNVETFFTDRFTFSQIDDKYAALHLIGHIIIEFQEMTGLGVKDRNKVKQWITQTHDEVRKPFAATTDKYPRQFVLAGTTNDTNWMTDPTGNRRFWPVRITRVDIARLEAQRDQLWAEAVHRYKAGEQWYIDDDDEIYGYIEQQQRERYVGDVWDELITNGIATMLGDITTDKILLDIIKLPKERWTNSEKYRIAAIMKSMGYENKQKRVFGRVSRVWEKEVGE